MHFTRTTMLPMNVLMFRPIMITLVRELDAASAVLLKNEYGALPLGKKDRRIALIGSGAGPGMAGPNQFTDHVR
jgi:beta-glucosidase-like glycosyl hydrolase